MDELLTNENLEIEERKVKFRYIILTALAMILPILPIQVLFSALRFIPFFSYLTFAFGAFYRGFSINWIIQFILLGGIGLLLGMWVSSKIIKNARESKIFSALPSLIGIGFIGGVIANSIVYFNFSNLSFQGDGLAAALFGAPIAGIIAGFFALIVGSIALTITDSLHYKKLRNGGLQLVVNGANDMQLNNQDIESAPLNDAEERIKRRYMFLTAVALSGPTILFSTLFSRAFFGYGSRGVISIVLLVVAVIILFLLGLWLGSYVGKTIIKNARKGNIYSSLGKLIGVGFLGGGVATALMYFALSGGSGEASVMAIFSAPFGAIVGGIFALISGLIALSITKALHY